MRGKIRFEKVGDFTVYEGLFGGLYANVYIYIYVYLYMYVYIYIHIGLMMFNGIEWGCEGFLLTEGTPKWFGL